MNRKDKIFARFQQLAAEPDNGRIISFVSKHLAIEDAHTYREFQARYEIWRLQDLQSKHVDVMRQKEKAYGRGIYKQVKTTKEA